MPGVVAKSELRKAIERDSVIPEDIATLVHQPLGGSMNVLDVWWNALSITISSLELAYRRGYQAGTEDAKKGKSHDSSKA